MSKSNTDDQYLQLYERRNSMSIRNQFRSSRVLVTRRMVPITTMHRRLQEGGLYASMLSWNFHIGSRIIEGQIAAGPADQWREPFCSQIIFTVHLHFVKLQSNNRRCLFWKEPGICHRPLNTPAREKYEKSNGRIWLVSLRVERQTPLSTRNSGYLIFIQMAFWHLCVTVQRYNK